MRCEAPTHVKQCYGLGDTKDHFTPRALGKRMGWKPAQINSPENLQQLSWPCHREKDAITPWELQTLIKSKGTKTIWEHHNEQLILRKGMPQL